MLALNPSLTSYSNEQRSYNEVIKSIHPSLSAFICVYLRLSAFNYSRNLILCDHETPAIVKKHYPSPQMERG